MLDQITLWFLLFLGSFYALLHLRLWIGSKRLFHPVHPGQSHLLTVIVAARNEEQNIGRLLRSMTTQNYPASAFEIIIVNDRSTDSTASIVEKFRKEHDNIRLFTIDSNTTDMPNKKNALRTGIEHAKFDILVFTDADADPGKEWLTTITHHFSEGTGVVIGYSPYASEQTPSFLRYEENKNSLIAAAAAGAGQAFLCTGRNIAYRKEVYQQVGGFEKIKQSISGDDDLFLQLVQRETSWKIRYMISPESAVGTIPPSTFREFVNQRTRHVSASSYYPFIVKAGYAVVHLFHAAIITALFISPFNGLLALMVKLNVDGAFIAHGKKLFREEFGVVEFVLNETLLVAYSFLIAPLGFLTSFDWKESVPQ